MKNKDIAIGLAGYLHLPQVYSYLRWKFTQSQIAILIYHRVAPKEDGWLLDSISPETFEEHIEYLCRSYEFLSLSNLIHSLHQKENLPKKAVVLTFDDGYKDNFAYAYPIIKKYGVPATIFLATGHIDSGRLFWWDLLNYVLQHTLIEQLELEGLGSFSLASDSNKRKAGSIIVDKLKTIPDGNKNILIERLVQICGTTIPPNIGYKYILSWDEVREMCRDGIEFGAHTVNHPILVNMELDKAKSEIIQSKKDIENELGLPVDLFAYPNGSLNQELTKIVSASGFSGAVSVEPSCLISSTDDLYKLNRVEMDENFQKCRIKLSGLLGDLLTARQKVRALLADRL